MAATAMTNQDPNMAEVMAEIRNLAATRKHRLAPHMLGTRSLTAPQASMVLQKLRSCPPLDGAPAPAAAPDVSRESGSQAPPPLSAFKSIPAGYYATRPSADSKVIDYWLVHKGKGKWEGHSFIRRVLGGSSPSARKLRTVELNNMQQRLALRAISLAGLEESQILFADTLERCTDCSAPLTDPVSRAARKGPTCRNKSR